MESPKSLQRCHLKVGRVTWVKRPSLGQKKLAPGGAQFWDGKLLCPRRKDVAGLPIPCPHSAKARVEAIAIVSETSAHTKNTRSVSHSGFSLAFILGRTSPPPRRRHPHR